MAFTLGNRPEYGNGAGNAGAGASISGPLPTAFVGQPYDASLIVTPPGTAVSIDAPGAASLAAHNITHDGFGRFTSASVS